MSKLRLLVMLAAALAATLVLAACGGDDDDGGGGEEDAAITETIETSVTTTDPEDCLRLQTQAFLEQSNFSTGEEAVQDCEEDVADTEDNPDSVDVENIEVDGSSATADASFVGGGFDGSTVSVELVKEGEQWKLDRIADVPELDLEAFQTSFVERLQDQEDIPAPIADCIGQAIEDASEDDIKQVLVSGQESDLIGLLGDCIPAS
jgi:hypothetical protein